MNDIIDSALQKGAFGLLFLILLGFGFLAWKTGPGIKTFLDGLIAELRLTREAFGTFREAILLELKELRRAQELAEERIKAHSTTLAGGIHAEVRAEATKATAATGQHAAQTAQDAAAIVLGTRLSSPDVEDAQARRPSPPNARRPFRSQPQLPPAQKQGATRPSVVLIVEDDPENAKALKLLLHAELGITASVAHSAAEAHAMLRPPAALPRVAIIDLHLGTNEHGVDEYGIDLAKEIPRSVAIIMVSGDRTGLERLSKAHAVAWFEKPIDFNALLAKVKEILAS